MIWKVNHKNQNHYFLIMILYPPSKHLMSFKKILMWKASIFFRLTGSLCWVSLSVVIFSHGWGWVEGNYSLDVLLPQFYKWWRMCMGPTPFSAQCSWPYDRRETPDLSASDLGHFQTLSRNPGDLWLSKVCF